MAFSVGDCVTPAAIYPTDNPASEGFDNGMMVERPLLGIVISVNMADIGVDWNNGTVADGTLNPFVQATSLRLVDTGVAAASAAMAGQVVHLTGKSQEYTGTVVSVFQLETATVNNTGALSDVAVVRTRQGFNFIALVSALEPVPGQ